MTKTTTIIAMIGSFLLGTALTAQAQAAADAPPIFVNVSAGGQFQGHEFSSIATFELFNETGTVTGNQTVDGGFVFDATVGYRVKPTIAGAIGVSTFNGGGSAAAIAAVPNPAVFGRPTIVAFPADAYGDANQSNVAINFQIVWLRPLTDRFDLAVFAGPSILHVKQDVASATPTQNTAATLESQSKTTGKAGTVGVDLAYRLNDRYGIGGFIRYLGGQVDLPAVENLTVGGVQAAGGIRIRF
jgi:hypothetical protein